MADPFWVIATALNRSVGLWVCHLFAPGYLPVRVEHESQRKGALNLFAAFDTRTRLGVGADL